MLESRKIVVTGGLSAGKTTACNFLKKFGAYTVNADEIVHAILSLNKKAGRAIAELLGDHVVLGDDLDRKLIAKEVAKNPDKLSSLEELLHPLVWESIELGFNEACTQEVPLFVAEIPILVENKLSHFKEMIWIKSKQRRYIEIFPRDFAWRIDRLSQGVGETSAGWIVNNDGSLEQLEEEMRKIFEELMLKGSL